MARAVAVDTIETISLLARRSGDVHRARVCMTLESQSARVVDGRPMFTAEW